MLGLFESVKLINPFPVLFVSDTNSDFASSPLDIGANDTRFFVRTT